jgi:membrane protein implicated in regulation of membrane protease activity
MSAVTLTFLAIGGLSLLLLLLSLRGHRFHHLHRLSHRLSHRLRLRPRSRTYALPAFSGFLGAFGFGGAIAAELSPLRGTAAALFAAGVGVLAGVPAAWLAGRFVAAVTDMPTDGTPHSADLVGATGVVISEVPEDGLGQVRVSFAGQPMKFNARSASPLALGVKILVIGVPTPTSVIVAPIPEYLLTEEGP